MDMALNGPRKSKVLYLFFVKLSVVDHREFYNYLVIQIEDINAYITFFLTLEFPLTVVFIFF